MKYKYIGIDGIDGCGKTTIINLLKGFLENKGYKVFVKKEPDILRDKIKEIINNDHNFDFYSGINLAILFSADRYLQNKIVLEKLNQGYIVLSDRTYLSTFAYQSIYENFDIDWLINLNKYLIKPDIVFILDLDPEIALNRINIRGDQKTSYERLEILKKVREKFLNLDKIIKDQKIVYINADRSPEEILKDITSYLV
ncbi:MAG: dTMP kinase [Nanopusillaceae archaeon]